MSRKYKNDDWLNIVNGILDTVSDFAHSASDAISRDVNAERKGEGKVIDYNEVAKSLSEEKVKWWKPVVKYIAGGLLLLPALVLFATSLLLSWLPQYILLALSVAFFVPSIICFQSAEKDRKLAKLIKQYIPVIGMRPEASIGYLSSSLEKKENKVKREVSFLLRREVFPSVAYYDKKLEILVLDGYREEPPVKTEAKTKLYELDTWINKLDILNLEIRNTEVSSKLSVLSDYVRKIRDYVCENPDREKLLRTFVNYYLPTTVKLTESYKTIEKMGEVGSNVAQTKQKIESSYDSLIAAYKNQLEMLYSAEAMDISGDIEVLETMIKRNGLDK